MNGRKANNTNSGQMAWIDISPKKACSCQQQYEKMPNIDNRFLILGVDAMRNGFRVWS